MMTKKKPAPKTRLCLIKECGREAKTRGLCQSCYNALRVRVRDGKVTWEQLEEAGLAESSGRKSYALEALKAAGLG